jgi:uncharacterized protein with WD repeat
MSPAVKKTLKLSMKRVKRSKQTIRKLQDSLKAKKQGNVHLVTLMEEVLSKYPSFKDSFLYLLIEQQLEVLVRGTGS